MAHEVQASNRKNTVRFKCADPYCRCAPRYRPPRGQWYYPEHTRSAYDLALALGADAVEPDLVASRDGVLVIRHENEISTTTDVASRAEFAGRRTTKTVDGRVRTGWFTEDFTWAELRTLRATEPSGSQRGSVASRSDEGILRFEDLLKLLDANDSTVGVVTEIKHASYFAALGLHLDELFASTLVATGWADDARLTVESFELTFFEKIRARGVRGQFLYLIRASGAPADQPEVSYATFRTDRGLAALAEVVDGISVDKKVLLSTDTGVVTVTDLVARAHAAGLLIYCWTLRPENRFLALQYRTDGNEWDVGNWQAEFELLLASGVDAVFADHPDLALNARDRQLQLMPAILT